MGAKATYLYSRFALVAGCSSAVPGNKQDSRFKAPSQRHRLVVTGFAVSLYLPWLAYAIR